ncbi:helix-turn-helix transcriptional regulator [Kitasatospora mediocidica]|uniref:helix-turn-helix transcriptional regulator n=1 Tax=Kitasatospora mediocidica TaxID=58352 RepID=UPI000563B457|nr:response regulator transcription factor [Kitasatospora mediocidica]
MTMHHVLEQPVSTASIVIRIHADDPITRSGAAGQLRHVPGIYLADDDHGPENAVTLVITENLDDTALARLRRLARGGAGRVVLVVGRISEVQLMDVVSGGVGAVVWRHEADQERLLRAVRAAAQGESDLPADLLGRVLHQVGRMKRRSVDSPGWATTEPTARETEILRLLADGLDTSEIARRLCYSERTVKNVLHGITTRFQLRNRAHAVAFALREGYI